jgi:hypothetical protein
MFEMELHFFAMENICFICCFDDGMGKLVVSGYV